MKKKAKQQEKSFEWYVKSVAGTLKGLMAKSSEALTARQWVEKVAEKTRIKELQSSRELCLRVVGSALARLRTSGQVEKTDNLWRARQPADLPESMKKALLTIYENKRVFKRRKSGKKDSSKWRTGADPIEYIPQDTLALMCDMKFALIHSGWNCYMQAKDGSVRFIKAFDKDEYEKAMENAEFFDVCELTRYGMQEARLQKGESLFWPRKAQKGEQAASKS